MADIQRAQPLQRRERIRQRGQPLQTKGLRKQKSRVKSTYIVVEREFLQAIECAELRRQARQQVLVQIEPLELGQRAQDVGNLPKTRIRASQTKQVQTCVRELPNRYSLDSEPDSSAKEIDQETACHCC